MVDENTQKIPLYCMVLRPVFFLFSVLVKLALLFFALMASYVLFVLYIWAPYLDTYGDPYVIKLLDESARVLVREQVGVEQFHIEQVWVQSAVFDGATGVWKVFLDDPYHLSEMSELVRNFKRSEKAQLDHFETRYSVRLTGYACFDGYDITTGEGTLCEGKSRRVCNVSVCVKEGERLIFLYIGQY